MVQCIKQNRYVVRQKILYVVNRVTPEFGVRRHVLIVGILMLTQKPANYSNIMVVKVLKFSVTLINLIGNRNNFATQKSCQNYCLSEACPPGTVVSKF